MSSSLRASKTSLFEKIMAYFILITMNLGPFIGNLSVYRSAALLGSSAISTSIFADSLTSLNLTPEQLDWQNALFNPLF